MADWSKPTITSDYIVFVDEVKNRDVDAITLQLVAVTNPPVGAIKLVRAPVKFQEWNGTTFVDIPLSVAGGGTGASTPGGAISSLGLGTMAYQNANAIAVTGGTIANINSSGGFTHTGGATVHGSAAPAHGLHVVAPTSTTYVGLVVTGAASSNGFYASVGSTSGQYAMVLYNTAAAELFRVRCDGVVSATYFMVIPVGTNRWAPV